jgi:thioredoxin 1
MTDKILKFSASWCGPCKSLAMTLKGEDLGVPVEDVDIDDSSYLAAQYAIRSVPTLVLIKDGKEVSRITGSQTLDAVRKWVSQA